MALTSEDRSRGGKTAQQRRRLEKRVRVVSADQVPNGRAPMNLEEQVEWASWITFAAATGLVDIGTAREVNRGLATLRGGLEKRDLLHRVRELEKQLKSYQQKSTTR
jgi:hypothetical protein